MTDEELIAALGWQECVLDTWDKQCLSHDYAHDDENGLRCDWLAFRLIGARAGIDLAREGIVQAIATADPVAIHVADPGGYIREAVCEIALEWQP